ncbi:MAG: hypothetical protein U0R24_15715 [Solirubrobacterales bacterium]
MQAYFIGMLGERYGWVPDEIPEDLGVREQWLIGGECAWPTSVTEMEISTAPFASPTWPRTPASTSAIRPTSNPTRSTMPERRFFREEPTPAEIEAKGLERAESVAGHDGESCSSSQRLVDSPFPAVEYSTPADLARRVQEDLEELVDRLYPKDEAQIRWRGEPSARVLRPNREAGVCRPARLERARGLRF